jgi:hypothetical protein
VAAGVAPLFGQAAEYYPVPEVDPPGESGDSQSAKVTQPSEGGVQLGLVVPQGDMRSCLNGRTGFSAGFHGAVPLDSGLELRPRLDYTRLDGGSFSARSMDSTLTLQGLGAGADILVYGDAARSGPYAFAGANLTLWYVKNRFEDDTQAIYPNLSAGVGARLNAFSADLEFDYGRFRPGVGTFGTVRLVLYYRFADAGN